jgi:hypothetical protein
MQADEDLATLAVAGHDDLWILNSEHFDPLAGSSL